MEMLGQRDTNYREEIGVPSIGGRVRLPPAQALRQDPEAITAQAAAALGRRHRVGGCTSI
jgi:hypothetical protein